MAEARVAGLSRRHLDGPMWAAPTRGVRIRQVLLESDARQRIRAIARALPADAVVSGRAAASLMGVRWFDGDQNVLVIRALDTSRVRRPGVTTRRTNLDEGETITIHGVRATSPQRTAFELLRTPPLPDAVAAVDAMLHAGLVTIEELVTAVDARPRWRSVRLRGDAPSPRCCGGIADGVAPPADLGARWASTSAGQRAALRQPHWCFARSTGSAGRGGGRGCRVRRRTSPNPVQHRADNAREHRLEEAGLIVIRFDGHDTLVTQGRTFAVMRSAHRRGLQRDRHLDRWSTTWRPWWE